MYLACTKMDSEDVMMNSYLDEKWFDLGVMFTIFDVVNMREIVVSKSLLRHNRAFAQLRIDSKKHPLDVLGSYPRLNQI
jgi:hypothetical protein